MCIYIYIHIYIYICTAMPLEQYYNIYIYKGLSREPPAAQAALHTTYMYRDISDKKVFDMAERAIDPILECDRVNPVSM